MYCIYKCQIQYIVYSKQVSVTLKVARLDEQITTEYSRTRMLQEHANTEPMKFSNSIK